MLPAAARNLLPSAHVSDCVCLLFPSTELRKPILLFSAKARKFPDGDPFGNWYDSSNDPAGEEEKARILETVRSCAQRHEGGSLLVSAIESEEPAMIGAVAEGIGALVPDVQVMLQSRTCCGKQ